MLKDLPSSATVDAVTTRAVIVTRRTALVSTLRGLLGLTLIAARGTRAQASADPDEKEIVRRLTGGHVAETSLIRLEMPDVFANGAGVPVSLTVESPMTQTDYVREVHLLAPRNPIIPVASFRFTPQSGRAMIVTRIRLSEPQNVLAVAELSDGSFIMTRRWVQVETDGCK